MCVWQKRSRRARIWTKPFSARWHLSARCPRKIGTDLSKATHKNKGPVPFGTEPSASDFAMLPLLVCNVSIARMQFFHHAFLKPLHRSKLTHPRLRGNPLVAQNCTDT